MHLLGAINASFRGNKCIYSVIPTGVFSIIANPDPLKCLSQIRVTVTYQKVPQKGPAGHNFFGHFFLMADISNEC